MGGCVVYLSAGAWRARQEGSLVQKPQGLGSLEFQNKSLFWSFKLYKSVPPFPGRGCSASLFLGSSRKSDKGLLRVTGILKVKPFLPCAHLCHVLPLGWATDRCTPPGPPSESPPAVSPPDSQQTPSPSGVECD